MKWILVFVMLNGEIYEAEYEDLYLCRTNGMYAIVSLTHHAPGRTIASAYCYQRRKFSEAPHH